MLDDWHQAAAVADEARYFGHFAPNGVFMSTDATERWDVTDRVLVLLNGQWKIAQYNLSVAIPNAVDGIVKEMSAH